MLKIPLTKLILLALPVFVFSQNTQFNADSAYSSIEHLSVTIGPRPMGSPAEQRALNWALQKFQSFGADSAFIMKFTSQKYKSTAFITSSGTAAAIFKGSSDSSIVVGGHIDSDDIDVPGANDNASGTAAAIELARIWSERPRRYTMIFCAFGGEEQGLLGSQNFVQNFNGLDNIAFMISTDMAASKGTIQAAFERQTVQAPKWLVRDAFTIGRELGLNQLTYPVHINALLSLTKYGPGSDHKSFLAKGIPAIAFTAGIGESPIHTPQDDMKLIDKTVLQDYGTFVDELLQKYHHEGIPKEETGRYVFWEVFGIKLFIPYWLLTVFNILTILLGIAAFFFARSRRIITGKKDRVRFSGEKLLLLFVIIIIFAHFGETSIQLIRGFRYAWVGHLGDFIVYTFIWAAAGFWLVLLLSRNWKFSKDPFVYSSRFLIVTLLFTAADSLLSARLAFYPAVTLFLLSIAVLVKNTSIKTVLVLAAPVSIYRFIFNEEILYISNIAARAGIRIDTFSEALLFNVMLTAVFILISLPLLNGLGYLAVSSERFRQLINYFRKPAAGISILVLIIAVGGYLLTLPPNNEIRPPFIRVNAEYKLPQQEGNLTVTGNEYFKDVQISSGSLNTFYDSRIHKVEVPGKFEADWLDIHGNTAVHKGELDTINFDWPLISSRPWLSCRLSIWTDSSKVSKPLSNLPFFQEDNLLKYYWFGNFSDTLKINGTFLVQPGARVIRKVTAKYAEMPLRIDVSSEIANVEYRTTVVYQDTIAARDGSAGSAP